MTKGKQLGICQVSGCLEEAKYGIYRTNEHGKKKWLYVCEFHEGLIGNENISRIKKKEKGY